MIFLLAALALTATGYLAYSRSLQAQATLQEEKEARKVASRARAAAVRARLQAPAHTRSVPYSRATSRANSYSWKTPEEAAIVRQAQERLANLDAERARARARELVHS